MAETGRGGDTLTPAGGGAPLKVLLVPDLPLESWPSMDRYASRLAHHLGRLAPDLDLRLAARVSGPTVESDGHGGPQPPAGLTGELRRYAARYLVYPARVRLLRADLVHVLDHSYGHLLLARRPSAPRVVTVHDLMPVLTVERNATGARDRIRNGLLRRVLKGLRAANAWIVATEWLRGELASWLGSDRGIHVIPYGIEDGFFTPGVEPPADTRRRLGLPASAFVVLHVGSVVPRKNIPAVIAAVAGLRAQGVDAWLLQLGGAFTDDQRRDLAQAGLERLARFIPQASEEDLRAGYRAADVLLFPSHYEGFGFPVLEAMASGTPVVTSGAGGLAEVAGDAAVVVGGREPGPYVAALRKVATSADWRARLVARGLERARRYRWADAARRTAEVYRGLVRAR
ncbi:MAG TPA: glycosyltransferase family 1 protein [Gemmatimonadales bacterium]|nr:glycosyltransferase family 1 protein [Gemmatimonadales bacterium]